ncbi:MAG: Luciferase-like monooxygenase [Ilumatobacteraceae bacterium]|nr:Luciferase-like monooxygenase [Ilumatobacteraceae bacterium]MCU1391467.1 Luciferase-like monooxygenase [Ilumatobacteraceae bacterium]
MIEIPSPCLVVLVGPAGSGKTTWANEHLPEHVVSSDDLRRLVGEADNDLRASADAFAVLDDVVARRLRRKLTTVIDSLGTDPARRETWRRMAADHGVACIAVVFDVPAAQLRRQNADRAKRVPDDVIRRQLAEWATVVATVRAEAFDAVHDAEVAALVPRSMTARAKSATVAEVAAAAPDARRLTFGLQLPQFTWPGGPPEMGERLRSIAVRAEAAGCRSLWVMDHFRQIPMMGPAWADMLESWTTLAHVAACTSTLRLGTLVTGITYRNVAHLAKIVATLDVLSGGRVDCGIGLGWFEDEHRAWGWSFPARRERYALLEDALQLLPRMWGPGGKPFDGAVLHVPDTSCYPRPLQAHVPIMVGGSGERRTLALVARYADACNLFGDPDVVAHKVQVLRQHCARFERDPAEISVSHLSTVLIGDDPAHVRALVDSTRPPKVSAERHTRAVNAGTVEQHVARVARYSEAGVDQIIVSLPDVADDGAVERLGRLISACAG